MLAPQIESAGISGKAIATALVGITKADATPLEGFQIMLRSASSVSAARIGREQIELHHQKRIAGFQLMRQMLALPALAKADAKTLVKVLAPLFDRLLAADGRV